MLPVLMWPLGKIFAKFKYHFPAKFKFEFTYKMKFCIYIQINIQMNDLIFLECSIFSIIVSRVANRECVFALLFFIYSVLILLFTSGVMFYDSNIAYFFIIKFIIWKIMAQNKNT